jgi:hypothetical protein
LRSGEFASGDFRIDLLREDSCTPASACLR